MGLVFLLLVKVDLQATVTTLKSASYGYLVPAALLLILFLALKAVRLLPIAWGYLLFDKEGFGLRRLARETCNTSNLSKSHRSGVTI